MLHHICCKPKYLFTRLNFCPYWHIATHACAISRDCSKTCANSPQLLGSNTAGKYYVGTTWKTNDEMRKITNDGNAIATGCVWDSVPRVDMK